MFSWPRLVLVTVGAAVSGLVLAQEARFGFGRPATPAEIRLWDIDVRPDGHGVRQGRGTVARGQEVYDAQCAACHGTFGESNDYLVIAGGVEPGDLQTGRASRLRDTNIVRTVGNKLNYASTLWDYIHRAMPWTNPQSLCVDDTYAVTAYVLHLNNIVGADFELNERSLLTLAMPNRNGMTTAHGMANPRDTPDVQGRLCMKNCGPTPTVISELPEYARNAHGNLAEQGRTIGPLGAIDTTRYDKGSERVKAGPVTRSAPTVDTGVIDAKPSLAKFGCVACHAVDARLIGPGMREVAAKYAGVVDATDRLAQRIRTGGTGVWGQISMPAQPQVSISDAQIIARWIAAGAK